MQIGWSHYYEGGYGAAADLARQQIEAYPHAPMGYRQLAAALGQLGRTAEAAAALDHAMTHHRRFFDAFVDGPAPWQRPEDYERLLAGLRKAGWQG